METVLLVPATISAASAPFVFNDKPKTATLNASNALNAISNAFFILILILLIPPHIEIVPVVVAEGRYHYNVVFVYLNEKNVGVFVASHLVHKISSCKNFS